MQTYSYRVFSHKNNCLSYHFEKQNLSHNALRFGIDPYNYLTIKEIPGIYL